MTESAGLLPPLNSVDQNCLNFLLQKSVITEINAWRWKFEGNEVLYPESVV